MVGDHAVNVIVDRDPRYAHSFDDVKGYGLSSSSVRYYDNLLRSHHQTK